MTFGKYYRVLIPDNILDQLKAIDAQLIEAQTSSRNYKDQLNKLIVQMNKQSEHSAFQENLLCELQQQYQSQLSESQRLSESKTMDRKDVPLLRQFAKQLRDLTDEN